MPRYATRKLHRRPAARSPVRGPQPAPESRLCNARRSNHGARHRRQYGGFQRGERRAPLSQIAALPGVLAAGATMAPPGSVDSTGGYLIDQLPAQPDWTRSPSVVLSIVAPGTFAALGIPLKSGRDFSDSDTLDRPFVAVVNEALVRRSFPNQNPIGRTIFCPFDSLKGMTIIGVVGDVRQRGTVREPM